MMGLLLALGTPALADEAPSWGGRQVEPGEPVATSLEPASSDASGSLQSLDRTAGGDLRPADVAPGGSLQALGGGSAAQARRIPPSEAQAVLKTAYPALHACVQEGLGPQRVELTLEVDVWIDGSVQQVRFVELTGTDKALEACMTKALKRLRFSPPGGEVAVPVRSSLWFAGPEDG